MAGACVAEMWYAELGLHCGNFRGPGGCRHSCLMQVQCSRAANLVYSYEKPAVDTCIIRDSRCGKSTMLATAAGLCTGHQKQVGSSSLADPGGSVSREPLKLVRPLG